MAYAVKSTFQFLFIYCIHFANKEKVIVEHLLID